MSEAGLEGVPLDGYTDQPLKLATIQGKPVIYSVGPDGKDDNAMVEWEPFNETKTAGDFLFRFEPVAN